MRAVLISLGAAFGITMATVLIWLCQRDPGTNFLPPDTRAEWIIFPAAVEPKARSTVNLDALFRREFTLHPRPQWAIVAVRAAKQIQLTINDRKVDLVAGRNWKDISTLDVSGFLQEGPNTIEATVFNDNGPPALWLSLIEDQLSVRTDQNWTASFAGSAWRRAVLARSARHPGPGNPIESSERTITCLAKVWPLWLLFGAVALASYLAGNWSTNRYSISADWITVPVLFGFAGLWLVLFWHNARILPAVVGFDASAHLNYIKYLQEHHSLPLPSQGIEMFQPPLYYVISAVLLSLFHLSTATSSGILLLRALMMVCGIAQIVLVFATLRLLFPGRPSFQLIGTGLAAFLPMHLYISHYPTNETLAGVLISASLYLAIRIVNGRTGSWQSYATLGLLLGAALLTKATALLAVPLIILALARQLASERASAAKWATTLGSLIVIAALTCTWHYLRASKFGSPLVGGSDPTTGLFWWQDDGYRTPSYFLRFGESLIRPLFSVTASFPDGLYSTLWGDGSCSGVSNLILRPPWNYNLMCAGYLLSLLPTSLLLVGAVAALMQLFRDRRSDVFIMVGMCLALAMALVYFNLRVPCYASVKTFYGLGALIPLGFFFATGWSIVTRGSRALKATVGIPLIVWAMNSFASFWIYDAAAQHINTAMHLSINKKPEAALTEAKKAVAADPSNAAARIALATVLQDAKQSSEALAEAERAIELAPRDGATHLQLGTLFFTQNNLERAIEEARLAVALAPENTQARLLLSVSLFYHNQDPVDAAREALAVSPYNAEIHRLLGAALGRKGDSIDAFNHLAYSVLIRPDRTDASSDLHLALLALVNSSDAAKLLHQAASSIPASPIALDELAWIFATHPSEELRDGLEAVRLAEHACALTKQMNPIFLATLAAAYAETGNFSAATNTIQESLSKARSDNNTDAIALDEKFLGFFQSNKPIRQDPNLR